MAKQSPLPQSIIRNQRLLQPTDIRKYEQPIHKAMRLSALTHYALHRSQHSRENNDRVHRGSMAGTYVCRHLCGTRKSQAGDRRTDQVVMMTFSALVLAASPKVS